MSDETIYKALRAGGLSPAGACAMMGNMACESGCISYRVQGDYKPPYEFSRQYTEQVDAGNINRHEFIYDGPGGGGYGLCQWTYYSRKESLYNLAEGNGVSIGNEEIQCKFCIWELSNEYAGLYSFLCTTEDLAEAAKRICSEYERPAVNNYADRINAAQRYFNQFATNDTGCTEDSCPVELPEAGTCDVSVRVLHQGCLGRDVFILQCGLCDMLFPCGVPDGDFGPNTCKAVMDLQKANGLAPDGVAGKEVWDIVLKVR